MHNISYKTKPASIVGGLKGHRRLALVNHNLATILLDFLIPSGQKLQYGKNSENEFEVL